MKEKTYYAPIATFFVFIFYVVLGWLIFMIAISSPQTFSIFFIYLLMTELLIERVIRLSYHLKIQNGKIYELGFFTRKRIISINLITKIRWKKQNFWSGGYGMSASIGDANWQRQYYIETPEHTLPKYAVTASLIKDLLKIRPDLQVEKGGLTFGAPFKSGENW